MSDKKVLGLNDMYKFYKENNIEKIDFKTFSIIIKIYNNNIIKYIIDTGKDFFLGEGLSFFGLRVKAANVICKKTGKLSRRINWLKSNQYKKQLLEEGKIVKSIDEPNGVEWFIYYTEDAPFWKWGIATSNIVTKGYKFIPAKQSMILKLFSEIKLRPNLLSLYQKDFK